MREPDIGSRGFMRISKGRIGYADVQAVTRKSTEDGDKLILSVILFHSGVRSGDLKDDVTIGTNEGQWWHSLSELRSIIEIERKPTSSKATV